MKPTHKHTKAANFLASHALPTEAEIDAMGPGELSKFLSDHGIDVAKLNADIPKMESQLKAKLALSQARQARLATTGARAPEVLDLTKDEIITALVAKYGRIEDIPLAARNFESMKEEDWKSLYLDLIARKK